MLLPSVPMTSFENTDRGWSLPDFVPALHLYGERRSIELQHLAKGLAVEPLQRIAFSEFDFLQREPIPVNGATGRLPLLSQKGSDFGDMLKAGNALLARPSGLLPEGPVVGSIPTSLPSPPDGASR